MTFGPGARAWEAGHFVAVSREEVVFVDWPPVLHIERVAADDATRGDQDAVRTVSRNVT